MRMLHPILFRFHPIMPCIYLASGYQHMVIVVASENSNHKGKSFWNYFFFSNFTTVQSRFSDIFWSPQKMSLNRIMSLNRMVLCSKLKNSH